MTQGGAMSEGRQLSMGDQKVVDDEKEGNMRLPMSDGGGQSHMSGEGGSHVPRHHRPKEKLICC